MDGGIAGTATAAVAGAGIFVGLVGIVVVVVAVGAGVDVDDGVGISIGVDTSACVLGVFDNDVQSCTPCIELLIIWCAIDSMLIA